MRKFRSWVVFLFGEVSWRPPGWLRHWRKCLGVLVLLGLVCWGASEGWRRYQNRPKPETVAFQVQEPGVTPLGEKLVPNPLVIRFEKSVAPLDKTGKEITSGVKLEPSWPGKWKWENDRTLKFEPADDWPAATKFRVEIAREAVAPQVLLEKYRIPWSTPAFTARLRSVEFYQDPTGPTIKQVVATVDFSHKVDPASVEKGTTFSWMGRGERQAYDVHYDAHHRTAWFRSKPLTLPEKEDFLKVAMARDIRTQQGGAGTEKVVEDKVRVPDIYSFFRIDDSRTAIVLNKEGEPDQFLFVTTTAVAKSEDVAKALSLVFLPRKMENGYPTDWSGPKEINADVLRRSESVKCEMIPSRDELSTLHTFRFRRDQVGQLYVKIDRDLEAPGGYKLRDDFGDLLRVPQPARGVEIQSEGGVLALTGERKVAIKSRGLPAIKYEIARVASSQINHLVSQTRGDFQDPEFRCYTFDEENISRISGEVQPLAGTDSFTANYSAFDFGPRLEVPKDGGSERGLFFFTARGWDPKTNSSIDGTMDTRFILITDLGLIVKKNADESRDVFVASIAKGGAVAGVQVDLLGKNGVPLASAQTDAGGRVTLPAMKNTERERKPVVIVARLGDDVAFLPYAREDRELNFSRFDIGGVQSDSGDELDAFLFTERGIYRPGDTIHCGYIVKRRDWQGSVAGLPVEMEVVDARGKVILTKRLGVPEGGFGELDCPTEIASASGIYSINLYLIRNSLRDRFLGQTEVNVKEFLPDRMKITSELAGADTPGWIAPTSAKVSLSLKNLYGSPATDRRVTGRMVLSPMGFRFDAYPGYRFYDRLLEGRKEPLEQKVELPDTTTDEAGAASFDLPLDRFADATYALTFFAEGFEADNGRSVAARNQVLVSPLPYVVGYKPDGDLDYITSGGPRAVHFLALDAKLASVAQAGLRFRLVEHTFVSVLTKQESGSYAYESVEREKEIGVEMRDLPEGGLSYALATGQPGTFVLEVSDASGHRLSKVPYTVVGAGSAPRAMEKDAELDIKLSAKEFRAGEEIEVAITAPYTGSGLITIERDHVYAYTWFTAPTTSSVQRIRIPEDFEGTGYVNVSFVRALDSKEIFTSPLSYAVVPFTAGRERRRLDIQFDAAKEAKPGEPFVIKYKTDRPSRIAVFAVDQGILQVSEFRLPDPLGSFFRQSALLVGTAQIMDLIMPEYSVLRAVSASGGGEDLIRKELNPFQRVTEKPVVYWSGILDAGPVEREVVYDVPDYFNGTLHIMAVAYASDAAGSVERDALIRSRFVITPGMPTVAAPGDVFEVGVTVNNGGATTDVALTAEPSAHLQIVKGPDQPLHIESGREVTVTFMVRATETLGSGQLTFRAVADGEESARRATVSVRPPVPFRTEVHSTHFAKSPFQIPVSRVLYPEYRKLDTAVSALPLGLARGLDAYLKNYPHGCSEQITSKAMSRLMLSDETDFGLTRAEVVDQLEYTFSVLRQRQDAEGSFGYWSAANAGDFISVYVTHFLVEARVAGFPPPQDLLKGALRNMQRIAGETNVSTLEQARIQAYAIYLLTREEFVTTNYVINLRDTLDRQFGERWKDDLTAVYLAGTQALLKQDAEAARLMGGYRLGAKRRDSDDYFTRLSSDSQYVAMLARHFPAQFKKTPVNDLLKMLEPIEEGRFSTLSAAYSILALKAWAQRADRVDPQLAIDEIREGGRAFALPSEGKLVVQAEFSAEAKAIRFSSKAQPTFCQTVEAGFDRTPPAESRSDGIEILREFPETAKVGDPITVKLKVRGLKDKEITNAAIVDLLPGGFEVVASSLEPDKEPCTNWDFVEVREDRVVFFGSVNRDVQEITYQIKPTNRGEYTVPPAFAESMYDRGVNGHGVAGKIKVTDAK